MATVKKKAAPKKKAAKASKPEATQETPALEDEQLPAPTESAAEPSEASQWPKAAPGLSREDVQAMVAEAVQAATREIVAAVTQSSPQTRPDAPGNVSGAPGAGGKPPAGMMTTYGEISPEEAAHVEGDDVDLELLELTDPIGYQMAVADKGRTPGGKRKVSAAVNLEGQILTAEQVENMTEEEIDEWNRKELARIEARKHAQAINRSKLEKMSPADRIRALTHRDPSVIREADNPLNERMIQCVAVRRVGLGEQGTSDLNETIKVPLSAARHLQETGAVKVAI